MTLLYIVHQSNPFCSLDLPRHISRQCNKPGQQLKAMYVLCCGLYLPSACDVVSSYHPTGADGGLGMS